MKKSNTILYIGLAVLAYFIFKDKFKASQEEPEAEPVETEKPVKVPGAAAPAIKSQAATVKATAAAPIKVTTVKNATILTAPIIQKKGSRPASVPLKFTNLKTGL